MVCTMAHKAPARAMTRGSPNRRAGALRPSQRVGRATRSKAGLVRTQPWPTRKASSMRRVTRAGFEKEFLQMFQPAQQTEITRVVHDGLDPERFAALEV